jgi:hypothetical protein
MISRFELGRLKFAGILSYVIAAVGAATSFGVQMTLLRDHGTKLWESIALPLTVDISAITFAVLLSLPRLSGRTRFMASVSLLVTVSVSIAGNILSVWGDPVLVVAHAWPVFAYLVGEVVTGAAKSDYARAEESAAQVEPIQHTETVVQPVVTPEPEKVEELPKPKASVREPRARRTRTAAAAPTKPWPVRADGTTANDPA